MKKIANNKGSLLIEVLIAIALFLAISTIIAQSLYVSFYSSRDSESKLSINSLISEQISNIRAMSDEHWSNIGNLSRNVEYYIVNGSDGLKISTGTFNGVVNETDYKLSFRIKDAARSLVSSSTELSLSTTTINTKADSSTILITSTGVINNKSPVVIQTIITRWRNIICSQGRWDSTSTNVALCETDNIYAGSKTNIEVGDQLKLCNGCK